MCTTDSVQQMYKYVATYSLKWALKDSVPFLAVLQQAQSEIGRGGIYQNKKSQFNP